MEQHDQLSTAEKYNQFVTLSPIGQVEDLTVVGARAAHLLGADGRTYIDCFAGVSVMNVGHSQDAILAAAQEQMQRLVHCGSYLYRVPVVADLAEQLARISPGRLRKSFFTNSGAEANEMALRLAKAATGKSEFIALQAGFHGRTNATLSVTGNASRRRRGTPYLPGVAFAPAPYEYRCRFCRGDCNLACADAVEDVITMQTSGEVAAMLAEPVLGEGGLIVPHPGYFRRLKQILDLHQILLVVDEVQTGFGRTGRMFGIEHYGVEPQIMTVAKAMAGGFPLGAAIAEPAIADSLRPGEHFSTFGGNPVSCAAGLATIEVLESQQLPAQAADTGSWLMDQLRELAARHESVGEVRGLGLMVALELVKDRTGKEPDAAAAIRVRAACREQGVLVGVGGLYGNVVRLQPPLIISRGELDLVLESLDAALG
ncbi:MAG TPA: aspartate aminotransferase family protein [Candidatus Acidoferrales bacterium]|nr:aspartate aminotransferase family protein [Candidatus Acidoferrales bacterium]